jgi:urease accessory protein
VPYDQTLIRPPAALQRGDGAAELVFSPSPAGTRLSHLYQRSPCRALFPRAEAGEPPNAVLLTTCGGLASGDRVRVNVAVEKGARATVTSQAAEKIYRSLGEDCRVDVTLTAESGAWLEFLPHETILFDGGRLRRTTELHVEPGGRLLACEMVVFGRVARGEEFRRGFLRDAWEIRRAGKRVWTDALKLDGDVAALLGRMRAFAGARALASALYVADDAPAHLDAARALLDGAGSQAAVTAVNGILLARFFGPDPGAVRRDLGVYLGGLRHQVAGLARHLPRVWYH